MKILISTGIICCLIMIIYYIKSEHPIKNALKGMISGGLALVIISFFGYKINIEMPLSFFNTGISLILGVPGVVLLILGNIFLV